MGSDYPLVKHLTLLGLKPNTTYRINAEGEAEEVLPTSSEGKRLYWTCPTCETRVEAPEIELVAAEVERLEAELNRERALGFKREDREMLLAEIERLREALGAVFQLAAVSWEGDPWYAEEEGIDGEAVLAQGRAALHHDEKEEE